MYCKLYTLLYITYCASVSLIFFLFDIQLQFNISNLSFGLLALIYFSLDRFTCTWALIRWYTFIYFIICVVKKFWCSLTHCWSPCSHIIRSSPLRWAGPLPSGTVSPTWWQLSRLPVSSFRNPLIGNEDYYSMVYILVSFLKVRWFPHGVLFVYFIIFHRI